MRKILVIILVAVASSALGALALFWYATAKAQMEVVENNAIFLKQQLFLEHYQLAFDYEKLSIGSHYLLPKIVMHHPVLTFATGEGLYRLKVTDLSFIGAFGNYDAYRIRLPETLMLVKEGARAKVTGMTIGSFPEVRVRSVQEGADQQEIKGTILNQIRVERGRKVVLEMPLSESRNDARDSTQMKLTYTPPPVMTMQWNKIRYQVHPYLSRFSQTVEKAGGAARLP